jgi:hypothetical protein
MTVDSYELIECGGCGRISLRHAWTWLDDGKMEVRYFPSPMSRRQPDWSLNLILGFEGGPEEEQLGNLFGEIYQAIAADQVLLGAMGIRAFLERVMIAKVGDKGTFANNLKAFHEGGYISQVQKEAMSKVLDAGSAVIHRLFKPTAEELNTALDIMEGIYAAIYVHGQAASKIADRVPPRPPRKT